MMRFTLVLTALVALGACGDDSGSGPPADARRIDAAPPIDGAPTGMVAGSMANVTLTERTAPDLSPVPGGCMSTIVGAGFSTDVESQARRVKPALPRNYLAEKYDVRHGLALPPRVQYAAGPADAGTPDAGGGGGDGGPGGGNGCQTLSSYPDAGVLAAQAAFYGASQEEAFITWIGIIGDGDAATQDEILAQVEFWPGFGALLDPPQPGTYTIAGEELDYNTCGVCVFAFGELTFDANGVPTDSNELLFATGGTVTLTAIQ